MRGLKLIGVMVVLAMNAAAEDDATGRLIRMMTGTFDTAAQVDAEARAGVAAADRHERRRVIYAPIDVPQVGDHVLFRQETRDGAVVARDLAVFEPDAAGGAIRMWLRRIPNADAFADLHLKPALWAAVIFDPSYGGKCPFHWRAENDGFVGTLDGGRCEIVSNAGRKMAFESRWDLGLQSLAIFDNTYDGDGKLLGGRADRVPTRYDRVPP